MIQNIVKLSCLGLFLSLISCGDETLPKPKGHLSLEYPKAKYSKLESNCSFTFDKNNLASIKDKSCAFEINYPKTFRSLRQGKVLGRLIGSGVNREMFGDIVSEGENWQVFVADEVSSFVQLQVTKMGNVAVRLEPKNYTQLLLPKDGWTQEKETVSSLRLDTVISTVFNISRQRSKQLIESGKIKVNWVESERPDFMLELLDIVSIRGFGRLQIQSIEGKTKKEKIKLTLGVLRK